MSNYYLIYFSVTFAILFTIMFYCLAKIIVQQRKIYEKVSQVKKNPTFRLIFTTIDNIKIEFTMVRLANNQLGRFVIGAPKDIKGEETTVQAGSLKVTSSNEEVFTVAQDEKQPENDMAKKIVAGRSGAAILTIEGDADLGEGVKPIRLEVAVEVTTSGAVAWGEPEFALEEQVVAETGNGGGNEGGNEGGNQ